MGIKTASIAPGASGVLLGRWIAKGGRQKEQAPSPPLGPPPAQGEPVKEPPNEPSKPAAPVDLFADMPCKLGDVVMRTGGDEALREQAAGNVRFR
jgi:hypothetical protein